MPEDENLGNGAPSAFIAREDGTYQPTELTRGPWNTEHQHAGPATALVAQVILQAAAPLGLTHMARLTASLWRPIPVAEPLKIVVETAYAGRNAGHFAAQLFAAGKEVARFTTLVQRESDLSIPPELPGHPPPPRARSGISAVLDFRRYLFVNNDLTINLFRRPLGEWICIDARTMVASSGSGLAEARIFDAVGLVGRSTQSLLIRSRE